jgi:hypothetical protein
VLTFEQEKLTLLKEQNRNPLLGIVRKEFGFTKPQLFCIELFFKNSLCVLQKSIISNIASRFFAEKPKNAFAFNLIDWQLRVFDFSTAFFSATKIAQKQ